MTQTVKWGYDLPGIFCAILRIFLFANNLYPDNYQKGFGKSAGEFAIRYYAKNLQKRGINANAIIPGIVNTDAWNGYLKKLGPKLGKKNRNTRQTANCNP